MAPKTPQQSAVISGTAPAILLLAATPFLFAQQTEKHPAAHDESWVRDVDPNAPCTFGPIFERISEHKSDPRTAFIEVSPFVHTDFPLKFDNLCRMISDQTEDTRAVFDSAHGFLHIVWGEPMMNEALAYFAGGSNKPGVVLYMKRFDTDFHPFVFAYRNQQWHDVTKEYLGSLNLTNKDYIVVPQYGRTARILTYDDNTSTFHHKLWLHWNGAQFEPQTAKPKDWRCPDSYRYFPAQERHQFCQ